MLSVARNCEPSWTRELYRVVVGQGVSLVGSCLTAIAVSWLVLSLTGNGYALGLCIMLTGLPGILLTLPAGVAVDLFTARRVAAIANGALALVVGALAVRTFTGGITMPQIYAAGLLVGTARAFLGPAQLSLVTQVTPDEQPALVRAASWSQGSMQAAQLASALLSVTVLSLVPHHHPARGCGVVFALDALTYLLCLAVTCRAGLARAIRPARGLSNSAGEGVRYICQERGLLYVFLGATLFTVAINGLLQVSIPMQVHRLSGNSSAGALGIVTAAFGLGGLIGAASTKWLKPSPDRSVLLQYGSIVVEGILFALACLARNTWQLTVFELVVGILGAYCSVSFYAMVQGAIRDEVRGRVSSVLAFMTMTPVAVLYPAIGSFAKSHTQLVYLLAAGILLAGGLILPLSKQVRALPKPKQAVVPV